MLGGMLEAEQEIKMVRNKVTYAEFSSGLFSLYVC